MPVLPRISLLLTNDIPSTGDAILSHLRRWRFSHGYDHTLLIQMEENLYGYRRLSQEELHAFLLERFTFKRMTTKGERSATRLSQKLVSFVYADPHDVLIAPS